MALLLGVMLAYDGWLHIFDLPTQLGTHTAAVRAAFCDCMLIVKADETVPTACTTSISVLQKEHHLNTVFLEFKASNKD